MKHLICLLTSLCFLGLTSAASAQQVKSWGYFSTKRDELSYIRFRQDVSNGNVEIRRCAVDNSGCDRELIGGREFSANEMTLVATRLMQRGSAEKNSGGVPVITGGLGCLASGFGTGILAGLAVSAATGVGNISNIAYVSGSGTAVTWLAIGATVNDRSSIFKVRIVPVPADHKRL
ncbi:MAG: hypothetical protein K2X47_00135 [Bdellovibrionales bacterium]|nr:hypothetical protein [Bdellovibrionales bacterium]